MSKNGSGSAASFLVTPRNDLTPVTRFWLTLERLPGLAAVRAQWQKLLGPDYAHVQQFLAPGPVLATSYPRLDEDAPGPPYSVIPWSSRHFVGICAEDGARIELRQEDVIVYHLDCLRLQREVAAAFGCDLDGATVGPVPFTFRLGAFRPVAGYSFPVYLTIQAQLAAFRQAVESVVALRDGPLLFLSPMNHFYRTVNETILRSLRICFIPLADALALGREGCLVLTPAGREALERFCKSVLPEAKTPNPVTYFPTPADATWRDLRLRFVDGHTVAAQVGDVHRTLHYAQMGMVDGRNARPTKQWELLRGFARGNGAMTWQNPRADRHNQKRRETLAQKLKKFFRIEGEPIVLTDDGKGWRTVFALEPDV